MTTRYLIGNCRDVLKTLPEEIVHCVVTSPPYWGLRDYGVAGQIGLEPDFKVYIATMVEVFREVRRVLRRDGTLWLNLGDSYATGAGSGRSMGGDVFGEQNKVIDAESYPANQPNRMPQVGLKPKDLCGIPWRVAFALQADGWVLRQEIVWAKPNPMPESVTDRCTKSHEQIFLFAKANWSGPDNGRFSGISDQDARWLAALIDAEGCIVVKRCQHPGRADTFAPQIAFGSTSLALISEFVRLAGHGNALERPGKNAPMFYWQLANNVARDFLHRIYPWLIVKKRQARIGIFVDELTYYRGGKKPERKQRSESEHTQLVSLWDRNKQCNRFGDPDLSDVPEPIYGKWVSCARYYYDAEAIKEDGIDRQPRAAGLQHKQAMLGQNNGGHLGSNDPFATRNKRSVWEIATAPFSEAHFATFPPALIEPCIKAGCPKDGTVLDPFGGAGTTGLVADRAQSRIWRYGPAADHGRRAVIRAGRRMMRKRMSENRIIAILIGSSLLLAAIIVWLAILIHP